MEKNINPDRYNNDHSTENLKPHRGVTFFHTQVSPVTISNRVIETIKAGYDRYIIVGQQGQDTTHLVQMPGSYSTTGTATFSGNTGFYEGNTVYHPGPMFVAGHHNQKLAVHMFKNGESGSQNALSAKETLGAKWADIVRDGVMTCTS
ncbi:hypothetical protein PY650_35705 [Rhizobium calliandrae]|uniref:Uncharacterized protein n=1 Tax=Rhizobium calliandrae TaxID=1312182 RepID=A0ABT7KQ87_9HYPH|nr:hypothetical protein [Rhizobium calliandrae]MDL2410796.1 hypothetical protein [Rhizobium calliandrae]